MGDDADNNGDDGARQKSPFFLLPLFRLNEISLDWTSCYIKGSFINIISTSAVLVDQGRHAVERKTSSALLHTKNMHIWIFDDALAKLN